MNPSTVLPSNPMNGTPRFCRKPTRSGENGRERRPHHEDLVLVDELLGRAARAVGVGGVVLGDELDPASVDAAGVVDVTEVRARRLLDRTSEGRQPAGQREDAADLDRPAGDARAVVLSSTVGAPPPGIAPTRPPSTRRATGAGCRRTDRAGPDSDTTARSSRAWASRTACSSRRVPQAAASRTRTASHPARRADAPEGRRSPSSLPVVRVRQGVSGVTPAYVTMLRSPSRGTLEA